MKMNLMLWCPHSARRRFGRTSARRSFTKCFHALGTGGPFLGKARLQIETINSRPLFEPFSPLHHTPSSHGRWRKWLFRFGRVGFLLAKRASKSTAERPKWWGWRCAVHYTHGRNYKAANRTSCKTRHQWNCRQNILDTTSSTNCTISTTSTTSTTSIDCLLHWIT